MRNSRPATRFHQAERLRRTAAPENREDRRGPLVQERPANARTGPEDIRLAPQARGLPPGRLRARGMNSSWPMKMPSRYAEFNRSAADIQQGLRHSINETGDRLCGLSRKADFRKWAALDRIVLEAQVAPMAASAFFTLGTRGSPLALVQANETRRRLAEAYGWEIERIALQVIRTTGDRIQDRPLVDAGGKGLFTKEIDAALIAGAIDAAVHSAKDLPSLVPDGVAIGAYLPREDVRDALISSLADTIEGLPRGATSARPRCAVGPRRSGFARPQDHAPARQCRDEASQGRVGRGRRHAAGARRLEAARPRPPRPRRTRCREVPARAWPGRDRHHGAQRGRAHARGLERHLGRRDDGRPYR